MKRLSADDSAGSRVKVGHRQANQCPSPRQNTMFDEGFLLPLQGKRLAGMARQDMQSKPRAGLAGRTRDGVGPHCKSHLLK